jgi:phage-related protein
MKPIRFSATALDDLRAFPEAARQDAGYQLHKLQCGEQPDDFTARLAEAVHVLHAFQKKTQRTARSDLDLARARFAKLKQERK